MENLALIDSFSEFKDEKLIDRVTLMSILEDVFRNTLKKKFGDDDNFDIIINPDKGDLEIWRNRVVVACYLFLHNLAIFQINHRHAPHF